MAFTFTLARACVIAALASCTDDPNPNDPPPATDCDALAPIESVLATTGA